MITASDPGGLIAEGDYLALFVDWERKVAAVSRRPYILGRFTITDDPYTGREVFMTIGAFPRLPISPEKFLVRNRPFSCVIRIKHTQRGDKTYFHVTGVL